MHNIVGRLRHSPFLSYVNHISHTHSPRYRRPPTCVQRLITLFMNGTRAKRVFYVEPEWKLDESGAAERTNELFIGSYSEIEFQEPSRRFWRLLSFQSNSGGVLGIGNL